MSFDDSPQIDDSARYSERSERKLREIMNMESGFICKKEDPDMGCDFFVELVLNDTNSSSWLFPIQLKSIEKLNIVNGGFISLSFATSRLRYLMERLPSMGLIIFYSVQEDKCFYDFSDKIADRLTEEKQSNTWQDQKKVSIHIPYTNILDRSTIGNVHSILTNRFEQGRKMHNSYGSRFNLPTFNSVGEFQYDFTNIDHIVKFLKEYGILMIENYDLDMIFEMISSVPHLQIYANKDLLLVAAISYCESGLSFESEIFCKKIGKYELNENERQMIEFVKLKNQLSLGYIDSNKYLSQIEILVSKEENPFNKLLFEINSTRYKLADCKPLTEIPDALLESIMVLFTRIDNCDAPFKQKSLFTLWNCENLSFSLGHIFGSRLAFTQLREVLTKPPTQEQWQAQVQPLIRKEIFLHRKISQVAKNANHSDDKFLKAYCLSLEVKHFISQHINAIAFDIPPATDIKERLTRIYSYAATATNYFGELNMFKDAYSSLCEMIEILELAELGYNIKIDQDKEKIYADKERVERDFDQQDRKIIFPSLIEKRNTSRSCKTEDGFQNLKLFSDGQLERLSEEFAKAKNWTNDERTNFLNQLQAFRLFNQRCSDPNILIIPFNTSTEAASDFTKPKRFLLKSKNSGIEIGPSADIDKLLKDFGF